MNACLYIILHINFFVLLQQLLIIVDTFPVSKLHTLPLVLKTLLLGILVAENWTKWRAFVDGSSTMSQCSWKRETKANFQCLYFGQGWSQLISYKFQTIEVDLGTIVREWMKMFIGWSVLYCMEDKNCRSFIDHIIFL